jgi:hypothetical protein
MWYTRHLSEKGIYINISTFASTKAYSCSLLHAYTKKSTGIKIQSVGLHINKNLHLHYENKSKYNYVSETPSMSGKNLHGCRLK